jgi:hypothetical protein
MRAALIDAADRDDYCRPERRDITRLALYSLLRLYGNQTGAPKKWPAISKAISGEPFCLIGHGSS